MGTRAPRRNAEQWNLFKCHQCGKCCTELGLPYDPRSVPNIAAFLGISIEDVIHTYYGKPAGDGKHWESEDHKRKPCPFLVDDVNKKACRIYCVRPEGCRAYPFDTDFGTSGVDCPAAKETYAKLKQRR